MSYKRWIGFFVVLLSIFGGFQAFDLYTRLALPSSDEQIADIVSKARLQDEQSYFRPPRQALIQQPENHLNNVYFGDLHVHTDISLDAYLFGNRFDMDTAYQVAKGKTVTLRTGESVELNRPLDFVALTDHAEGFGPGLACAEKNLTEKAKAECDFYATPSLMGFLELRGRAQQRPPTRDLTIFDGEQAVERKFAASTWQMVKDAAERHNDPGVFTTFIGYEYSPALPDRGKLHRNVIFRSHDTPEYAISAFDAESEIDLWQQLESTCVGDCEFLTIPHNMNKSWGLAFSGKTIDGLTYSDDDWRMRARFEPMVEMFQIKGNSECSLAFGFGDEECGYEQFFPPCDEGQETSCIYPTSMARDGLHMGLALQQRMAVNPLKFGFVGATDTHNSNPGDTEEWDYRGATAFASSPAERRYKSTDLTGTAKNNPGGLAAVWASENTRDALFDAMKRKEVYATSGTRISLRTFLGFNLPKELIDTIDLAAAYAGGIPMGGNLIAPDNDNGNVPSLFIWAVKDPDSAPLAKAQVIKGWIEDGQRREQVFDVFCTGSGRDATTGNCIKNDATVDLNSCQWDTHLGVDQIKVLWTDPDYDAQQSTFYYVRIVQNPTCRWTTYDSLRLGMPPRSDVPATVTEMAWGSPMWIDAE